jgi:imidazolonepropionase-like amidohydrolase
MSEAVILRADRWADIDTGRVRSPAVVVVVGNRIAAMNPADLPAVATEIDLGDVTLLPGLMDMKVDLFVGDPGEGNGLPAPMHGVQEDPVYRAYRASVNARKTLLAGFTTVRNVGLMVKTGGCLIDVALARAIDEGWTEGPRVIPAGHAITAGTGHVEPRVLQQRAPGATPLSLEEGVANGVSEVRKCVRHQICNGAKVIKILVSGDAMLDRAGLRIPQYSDDELDAIVDEARRAGVRVAAHAIGDKAIEACILSGVDCIEHGYLAAEKTIEMMVDCGVFLVSTTCLTKAMTRESAAFGLHHKAADVFPAAKAMLTKAIEAGVKVACGTDAPILPHGENAKELVALVSRGMTPMQALRAATLTSAELIGADTELGRLAPGYLADVIAVPDNPRVDITTTQNVCFVMKDGRIHKMPSIAAKTSDRHADWCTDSSPGHLRLVPHAK